MKVRNLLFALAAVFFAATAAAQFHGSIIPSNQKYIVTKEDVKYYLYDDDKTAMLASGKNCIEKSYEIPESVTGDDGTEYKVTEIKVSAFGDNEWLESITIPSSVQVINDAAFNNCPNLKTVNAPETKLYYMGGGVFYKTPWLTAYKAKYNNELVYWRGWVIDVSGSINGEDVMIADGTVGISDQLIGVNSSLVYFPASLKHHGGATVFRYMKNVTDFFVPKTNTNYYRELGSDVLYRRSNTYSQYDELDLAGTGQYLAKYPVAKDVFEKYTTKKGIVGIDQEAFYEAKYLKEVIVSEGVRTLGINAFRNMPNLEYLELPSSIKDIASSIYGCPNLKTIIIRATQKPEMNKNTKTFGNCSPELIIYVPASMLEEYKADKAYSKYAKEIRAIDSRVVGIGQAKTGGDAEVKAIYSTDGTRLNAMQKGVNIVRMSDGTVRKVVRK